MCLKVLRVARSVRRGWGSNLRKTGATVAFDQPTKPPNPTHLWQLSKSECSVTPCGSGAHSARCSSACGEV